MTTRDMETLEIAMQADIQTKFMQEVTRIILARGDDPDESRGLLFGVALENLADSYLRGERKTRNYKNLRSF